MPRLLPNRSAYVGSEAIMRRLRAAKRPDIIVPLEIPPEEMEVESATIAAGAIRAPLPIDELNDITVLAFDDVPPPILPTLLPIFPARLSADEIVPDDSED